MSEEQLRPLIAALKEAIQRSGKSLSQIARENDMDHGQLSRFMRGERTLTLDVAAKLFDHFGLSVGGGDQRPAAEQKPESERPMGKRK